MSSLALEVVRFARLLRGTGFGLGTGRIHDGLKAVRAVGLDEPEDFYWTLHTVFVSRPEQREIFNRVFRMFWSESRQLPAGIASESAPDQDPNETAPVSAESIDRFVAERDREERIGREPEIETGLSASSREQLSLKDFEKMSAIEMLEARKAIEAIVFPKSSLPTRRFIRAPNGERIDMRASLRAALRSGSATVPLIRKRRRVRPSPIVVISDISGSMSHYSRMLLHFVHALGTDRDRVHSFVFGTRLTNITRYVRTRNVDKALERVAGAVEDWSGGTRIGQCLRDFNKRWSRRVLTQGALVLLITDGLDRDAGEGLSLEMDRLHRSCRRLIWLNPLLRYDRFEPRSLGMRAMLPHTDEFRTVHNLKSLVDLSAVIGESSLRFSPGGRLI